MIVFLSRCTTTAARRSFGMVLNCCKVNSFRGQHPLTPAGGPLWPPWTPDINFKPFFASFLNPFLPVSKTTVPDLFHHSAALLSQVHRYPISCSTLTCHQLQYTDLWSAAVHWSAICCSTLIYQLQNTDLSAAVHWCATAAVHGSASSRSTLICYQLQYIDLSAAVYWSAISCITLICYQLQYTDLL